MLILFYIFVILSQYNSDTYSTFSSYDFFVSIKNTKKKENNLENYSCASHCAAISSWVCGLNFSQTTSIDASQWPSWSETKTRKIEKGTF